ncbi:unnamed protein product [Lymnaea stagnalis]|uniref:Uncharacterized protein n=1 Tax=Lymnaea stagnalis TaxID=6523 RepID=A0AAV2HHU3_LYMST
MSKTFILKRNSSPDSMVTPRTPETRTKSLPRESSISYTKPYHRSEFGIDGGMSRCPVHDTPRSVTTSPRLTRDNTYHIHGKNVTKRFNNMQNWNTIYTSKMPSYQMSDLEASGPSTPKSSKHGTVGKHKDLKRKMVFDLHKEIKKGINTTSLEEISDMERITEICLATLKSMMDSKKYRKYLHHMNNNALAPPFVFCSAPRCSRSNLSNNADGRTNSEKRKDSLLKSSSSVFARAESKKPTQVQTTQAMIESARTRATGGRLGYISVPGVGRILRSKETDDSKTRKLSGINYMGANSSRSRDTDVGLYINREDNAKTLRIMAEIQAQMLKQEEDDRMSNSSGRMADIPQKHTLPLMTPEEALACKWLRLTPQQVAVLEELIRQRGLDPGIHEHSQLNDYDVFAEIRKLRLEANSENENVTFILEEEDEETDDVHVRAARH